MIEFYGFFPLMALKRRQKMMEEFPSFFLPLLTDYCRDVMAFVAIGIYFLGDG
jgi:hypothetical protein